MDWLTNEKNASILKGALIAAAGAALTYAGQWASNTDLGVWGPLVAAGLAVAVNALRKYATPEPKPEPKTEDVQDDEHLQS